jgi:cytochrome P450
VWNGETVSLTQAAANVAAIAMAAYETTALTLSWMLFLLTQHPEATKALIAELEGAGSLSSLDADGIEKLPLLDGAVKETMRLVTPVPVIGFEVMEDCKIDDIALHRGARIFISPHLTHRLESVYEHPRRFMPERWASIKPSAYEYLPFNAGPRRCPGIWFASANLKIALATIVERFRFDLAPNTKIDRGYAATTIAKNGVPMIFSPRDACYERSACAGDIMRFFDLSETVHA